jgi:hypothetical protein
MTKMYGVGSIQQCDVLLNAFRDDDDDDDDDVDGCFDSYFDDYYDDPCRDRVDGWDDTDDECLTDQFSV